jgi:hypothetical protein
MKLKLWDFEYEFDRDDAKIVVPLILSGLALAFAKLDPIWVIAADVFYYSAYFFGGSAAGAVKAAIEKQKMRCPKCGNRKIYLQGYEGYNSDAHHAYYFCDNCRGTSILTDGGLLQIDPPVPTQHVASRR